MTLLELLVEELPGRGGWPNRGILAVQDVDKWICFSTLPEVEINGGEWGNGEWGNNGGEWVSCIKNCEHLAEDYSKAIITREQYEAALAASKPEWDGEGLPPVGTEAEVSVDGGRTWCLYRATSEHNGMRLVEIGNFTEEFQSNNWMFRPMRSEADKKRENLAKALHIAAGAAPVEVVGIGPLYLELADKILAGEVAGIRID